MTLIYGCMGLGGGWDTQPLQPADIDAAADAIAAALDIGVGTLDLADIYRHGKSEQAVGEVLVRWPGLRERIAIQTKCGIRLDAGAYDLRGASIEDRVSQSLRRLRTDVIDVLLLHRPDPLADPADIAKALTALHRQGVVRRFGVSNMSAQQLAYLQAFLDLPLEANQLEMSLGARGWVEDGVLLNTGRPGGNGFPHGTIEYCRRNGIQLQAWAPLARGRYTGGQHTVEEQAAAALVAELAERKQTTPESIVLWWLRRHPAGIVPVVGTSRPERIRACRDAAHREPDLSHEEWYALWIAARGAPLP
jgi:predicted oxidoreductase